MPTEEDAVLFPGHFHRAEILAPAEFKRAVSFGALQAETMVKKVLKGERVKLLTPEKPTEEKIGFGELLIQELNARIEQYHPGIAGHYRISDDVRLGGLVPVKARDLKNMMYLFGIWLQDEVEALGSSDKNLLKALEVAAGAHYGLAHLLHPFEGGNGRTSRALMNGILLIGTEELRYGQDIRYPIPLLRTQETDESKMVKDIEAGREVKMEPYIRSIMEVEETGDLGPFELHLANAWLKDLEQRGNRLGRNSAIRRHRNRADDFWIGVIENRITILGDFVDRQVHGRNEPHLIPDYFAPRHIKVA